MALTIKKESKSLGVTFDEAYARISAIQYNADKNDLRVSLSIYAAKSAREKEQVLAELNKRMEQAGIDSMIADNGYREAATKADTMRALLAEKGDKAEKKDTDAVAVAEKNEQKSIAALHQAHSTHKALRDGLNSETAVTMLAVDLFTFPFDDKKVKEQGLLGYCYELLKNTHDLNSATNS